MLWVDVPFIYVGLLSTRWRGRRSSRGSQITVGTVAVFAPTNSPAVLYRPWIFCRALGLALSLPSLVVFFIEWRTEIYLPAELSQKSVLAPGYSWTQDEEGGYGGGGGR